MGSLQKWLCIASIREQQRGELIEAAPPGLPFVGGVGGFIEGTLDASLLQRFDVGLASGAILAASVTDEHDFDLLLEGVHVGDFRRSNAATAENADVRKLVEVRQGD